MAGNGVKDIAWLRQDGSEMTDADWQQVKRHQLGMMIHGQATDEMDGRGRLITGNTLLLLVNASGRGAEFKLPVMNETGVWRQLICTGRGNGREVRAARLRLASYSLVLLEFEQRS